MAILEDVWKGSWGVVLVGVGVALIAPTVLPAVGAAIRPLAKSAIKGGVLLYDTVKESIAEAGEQVNDMVAEVRAEMEQDKESLGAPRRRAHVKKAEMSKSA